MTGRQLAAALAAIVTLTVVVPPWAARDLHHRRIARATAATLRLAQALGTRAQSEVAGARAAGHPPLVLSGSVRAPEVQSGTGWPSAHTVLPTLVTAGPDPWGNDYVVAVPADPAAPVTVCSAGPDGHLNTPFTAATRAVGDDIVAVVPRTP